jgi:hypothetical protein
MMETVGMQQLTMEMMPKPPRIQVAVRIGALLLVPLHISSEGEVSTSFGISLCWISDPSTRGESI